MSFGLDVPLLYTLSYKINGLHERTLRIIYNDKSSSFQKLLDKDNSLALHHRNISTKFPSKLFEWVLSRDHLFIM